MNSEVVKNFLNGYSIEVTPNAAAKIENFAEVLPANTRIYIAHIEGTPFEDMLKTAKKITDEGFSNPTSQEMQIHSKNPSNRKALRRGFRRWSQLEMIPNRKPLPANASKVGSTSLCTSQFEGSSNLR